MSRKNTIMRRSIRRPAIIVGIVVFTLLAIGWSIGTRSTPPQAVASDAPHFVDLSGQDTHAETASRTVVIARLGETLPGISAETGPLMTMLVRGSLPEQATSATVRTDENCTPDQAGI